MYSFLYRFKCTGRQNYCTGSSTNINYYYVLLYVIVHIVQVEHVLDYKGTAQACVQILK